MRGRAFGSVSKTAGSSTQRRNNRVNPPHSNDRARKSWMFSLLCEAHPRIDQRDRMRSLARCRWLLLTLLCIIASTHAQTVMTLPGDRIYQGSLEDGEPYGAGTMVYP